MQKPPQQLVASAERGDPQAQDALGRWWFDRDTPEGHRQAKHWSELASVQGVPSADARLATIYHEGLGVERNPQRAAGFYLRAARAGHVPCQLMIGIAYHVGAGVNVDRVESAFWLSVAAAHEEMAEYYLRTHVEPELTREEKIALEVKRRHVAMQ